MYQRIYVCTGVSSSDYTVVGADISTGLVIQDTTGSYVIVYVVGCSVDDPVTHCVVDDQ